MTVCAPASVPVASGPLLNVESFSALAPVSVADLADVIVPCFAVASLGWAVRALPARNCAVAAVDVPGVARVRVLAARGAGLPESDAVVALAGTGALASVPVAGVDEVRLAEVKIAVAPAALAGTVDAAPIALGAAPCVPPCASLTMAAGSATVVKDAQGGTQGAAPSAIG